MANKKIASTIMLHLEDGTTKFLVQAVDDSVTFATTQVATEQTGLASALQMLKNTLHIDVTNINLVELTNTSIADQKMPLFVFEAQETAIDLDEMAEEYLWEDSARLQTLLADYQFDGVPFF